MSGAQAHRAGGRPRLGGALLAENLPARTSVTHSDRRPTLDLPSGPAQRHSGCHRHLATSRSHFWALPSPSLVHPAHLAAMQAVVQPQRAALCAQQQAQQQRPARTSAAALPALAARAGHTATAAPSSSTGFSSSAAGSTSSSKAARFVAGPP